MMEFLKGLGIIFGYFVLCLAGALLLRRFFRVRGEVFRKTLHIIVLFSVFAWLYAFETWWISALAALSFAAILYPALSLAERIDGYAELFTQRKAGEIRRSLVVMFVMVATLVCVFWGWLGVKWPVLACVCAWGFGDAAAALVGKKFGKHALEGRLIEGRKSVEGTLAMFVVSFIAVFLVLLVNGRVIWYIALPIALVIAAVSAVVELYTRNGMDTITCPLAAAAVLLPLVYLWGM